MSFGRGTKIAIELRGNHFKPAYVVGMENDEYIVQPIGGKGRFLTVTEDKVFPIEKIPEDERIHPHRARKAAKAATHHTATRKQGPKKAATAAKKRKSAGGKATTQKKSTTRTRTPPKGKKSTTTHHHHETAHHETAHHETGHHAHHE